jgi:hypothetical protein
VSERIVAARAIEYDVAFNDNRQRHIDSWRAG